MAAWRTVALAAVLLLFSVVSAPTAGGRARHPAPPDLWGRAPLLAPWWLLVPRIMDAHSRVSARLFSAAARLYADEGCPARAQGAHATRLAHRLFESLTPLDVRRFPAGGRAAGYLGAALDHDARALDAGWAVPLAAACGAAAAALLVAAPLYADCVRSLVAP